MKSARGESFRATFGRAPEFLARAPGRIEFIGNHTDYNGGTVLGAAIDRGVTVALARREDGKRNFASGQKEGVVRIGAGDIARRTDGEAWVNYPLGVIAALTEFGLTAPGGFDYLAMSDLPTGAGLSSSAAIELASALVFLAATGQTPSRETIVKLGRHAENHFVGVPCGILDQGVSGFGRKDHLVAIDCRGPSFSTVPLPVGAHFWIFNTHTKHALVDGLYAARHRECMEAAKALGVTLLADVSENAFIAAEEKLPPVLRKRAKHVIEEIARVDACLGELGAEDLHRVGILLSQSHRSSQLLFENSTAELDFLCERLFVTRHVYGARLTGGGFGGAVMALTNAEFGEVEAGQVADAYTARFGARPEIMHAQTGDGAMMLEE